MATPAPAPSARETVPLQQDEEVLTDTAAGEVSCDTLPFVSHVAPIARDLLYDRTRDEMLLPVEVRFRDGTHLPTVMRVDPGRVELLSIQLAQAIDQRQKELDARAKGL
ncbi:hypothetical protein [Streptomyces sp. NPDC090021]|uniref:hypothetical protein n=1 Tax=Streptomyces sp. NPDC090021 TaxID=3365919 RepID=UPI003804126A